jgi:hypothetical protein
MGSPLSLVIAKFYMEDFKEKALDQAPHKPLCWFSYVDDTFIIWPHGPARLKDFLNHLNNIYQCIQFTMEMERDSHLLFLEIGIYRKSDASLGHKVYCKPTHINLYLNTSSHHHPSSKHAALFTPVHGARALCDHDSLQVELWFLGDALRQNGYND